jgi:hypothetical protein
LAKSPCISCPFRKFHPAWIRIAQRASITLMPCFRPVQRVSILLALDDLINNENEITGSNGADHLTTFANGNMWFGV